jgi:hypothetical protein
VSFSLSRLDDVAGVMSGAVSAQAPQDRRSQLDSWIAVAADGTVTAYTGKCIFQMRGARTCGASRATDTTFALVLR